MARVPTSTQHFVDVRNEREQFLAPAGTENARPLPQKKYYTPVELQKSFLICYCIFILAIFTMLQLIAFAYAGTSSLSGLIPRSAQDNCPPGATCAPAPGSWSDPNTSPSGMPTAPTAPRPGSWTDAITQSAGWGPGYYFVGGYLPTLAAILLSTWWKSVFSKLKEMEPIYQLNKTTATLASARDAIRLSYTSTALPKVFYSSMSNHRWLTWFGSVNMILIHLCTTFASEAVYISTTGSACHVIIDPTASTNKDCQMHLSVRRGLLWALAAVLFVMFVLVVILILRLQHQVSGIYAEVSSIAGITGLYQILLGKGLIESRVTASESALKGHENIDKYAPTSTAYGNLSVQQIPTTQSKPVKGHKSMHPICLALFWLYLLGVLVMILYYRFVSKPGTNNGFEDFMDSESFGIKLFMTCVGLAIKFYWGAIEKHSCSTAPYIAMASEGGATAEKSILMRTPSHPVIGLFYGSSWHQPLLGLVTISAVLSEVLVITLNTVPFSVATAYVAFEISVYISIGIIILMVITIPLVLVWQLQSKRKTVVEAPECIAEALAMIDDDLRANLGDLRDLDRKQRDRVVKDWGYSYSLEAEQSPDGLHCEKIVAYRIH